MSGCLYNRAPGVSTTEYIPGTTCALLTPEFYGASTFVQFPKFNFSFFFFFFPFYPVTTTSASISPDSPRDRLPSLQILMSLTADWGCILAAMNLPASTLFCTTLLKVRSDPKLPRLELPERDRSDNRLQVGLDWDELGWAFPLHLLPRHGFASSFEVVPIQAMSPTVPPTIFSPAAPLRRRSPAPASPVPPVPPVCHRCYLVPLEQACQFGDSLALDRLVTGYLEWSGDAAATHSNPDSATTAGAGALNVNSLPTYAPLAAPPCTHPSSALCRGETPIHYMAVICPFASAER